MKVDIDYSIVAQKINIYIRDFANKHYFIYHDKDDIEMCEIVPSSIDRIKPFLSLPFDFAQEIEKSFAKRYNAKNPKEESSNAHIEDLRWVLEHFIDKDKKE